MHKTTFSLITLLLSTLFAQNALAADLATGGYSREFQQMGMMKMLDADGNHMVTTAEFNQYYGALFDALDSNHDGKLDKTEWVGTKPASTVSLATGGYLRELGNLKMMDKMDTNKDHFVSKDEFLQYQNTVFSKLDTSGDKQLDAQEYVANLLGK